MIATNGELKNTLKDFYGKPIRTGLYLLSGPSQKLYFINLSEDGNGLIVESTEGEVYNSKEDVANEKEIYARQFVPLSDPLKTIEFILSKLPHAERQSLLEKLALMEKS